MTPLTPGMLEVVRELRGIASVSARLRFVANLLTGSHPTPLEVRIQVARVVLLALAGELDAAQVRLAKPSAARVAEMLEQIGALARGRIHVRNDKLAKVYRLAREAGRVLRTSA